MTMLKLYFFTFILVWASGSVFAQKGKLTGQQVKTPPPSKVPYRLELEDKEFPDEIILAVGTTTTFHCPSEALNVVISGDGIETKQSNPTLKRHDLYVRASKGGIRTNMALEFQEGTFIVNLRTTDIPGGAKNGDYHGEVWIKGKGGSNPGSSKQFEHRIASLQADLKQRDMQLEQCKKTPVTQPGKPTPIPVCPPTQIQQSVSLAAAKIEEIRVATLNDNLIAMGRMGDQLKPKVRRKIETARGKIKLGLTTFTTVDNAGNAYIGLWLSNQDTSPVFIEEVFDPNSTTVKVHTPKEIGRYADRKIPYDGEAWFWVAVSAEKPNYQPTKIALTLSSGTQKWKVELPID